MINERLRPTLYRSACVLLAALLAPAPALAGQDPAWMRSLDDLLRMEITTASKRDKRLADTAAAAFVLTRDEIRRSGLTTVPDLLRLVPGVHVARIDGNQWAVSVRGFNGRWANKLLVMIDGRSVYSPLFSGVFWDVFDVPVELIDRIEVVRGPGGSLWGGNAVNGVINIMTRGAAADGGTVVTRAGTQGLASGVAEYGASLGSRLRYSAFAGATQRSDSFPVSHDRSQSLRFGVSASMVASPRDTVEVRASAQRAEIGTLALDVTRGEPITAPRDAEVKGQHAAVSWHRTLGGDGDLLVAATWTSGTRDDPSAALDSSAFELSAVHSAGRVGRHEVTWGGGYRRSVDVLFGSDVIRLEPQRALQTQTGMFVQDEISLAADQITLTVGTKLEHFTHTGWHLQPTARLHWHPTARQTAWAAISRAVRQPSLAERGLTLPLAIVAGPPTVTLTVVGNSRLKQESLRAVEAGYRWAAPAVSVDVAGYFNIYDDLVAVGFGSPYLVIGPAGPRIVQPLPFENTLDATAAGGEALVTVAVMPRWRVTGGYSLFTVNGRRIEGGGTSPSAPTFNADAPRHQGTLRSMWTLPRRLELDTTIFRVGALRPTGVPSYTRFDVRLAHQPQNALEFALLVRNAFDSRHFEFLSVSDLVAFTPSQRQVSLQASWRF